MALDFHRLDNNEYLFGLDDVQFNYLADIFQVFTYRTGLIIDQYDDLKLTAENQQTLIAVIDKYIIDNDLNKNKQKTSVILELKGILKLYSRNGIDLEIIGD